MNIDREKHESLTVEYIEFEPMRTGLDRNDQPRHDHRAKSSCHYGAEYVGFSGTYCCRCKPSYYGFNCDKHIGEIFD
jgi:hypothetical protein